MKKSAMNYAIIIWLVAVSIIIFFMLYSSPASGFAGEEGVEVGVMRTKAISTGEICFVEECLQRTGIFVSPEARQYPSGWRKVFEDVGEVVPIVLEIKFKMDGLFHYVSVRKYEEVLFYDDKTQIIVVAERKGEIEGERVSAFRFLAIPIAVVVVLILLILIYIFPKGSSSDYFSEMGM